MKNVKFASISDQLINTAIIMDMMFNTEMIVKDMKGGKEDMTEKRFTVHIKWFNYDKTEGEITLKDNGQLLLESECIEDVQRLKVILNELNEENEQLKQQKEVWKQICCTNSSFNSILLHELDVAREQGFEVSNPFKQFLEDKGDEE